MAGEDEPTQYLRLRGKLSATLRTERSWEQFSKGNNASRGDGVAKVLPFSKER